MYVRGQQIIPHNGYHIRPFHYYFANLTKQYEKTLHSTFKRFLKKLFIQFKLIDVLETMGIVNIYFWEHFY